MMDGNGPNCGELEPRASQLSKSRTTTFSSASERNLEAILAIDELARRCHRDFAHLVQHALGPDRSLHSTLHVPDVGELGGHIRAIEAGVEHDDGHAHGLELLRHEHASDVARSPGHVVAVVAALVL